MNPVPPPHNENPFAAPGAPLDARDRADAGPRLRIVDILLGTVAVAVGLAGLYFGPLPLALTLAAFRSHLVFRARRLKGIATTPGLKAKLFGVSFLVALLIICCVLAATGIAFFGSCLAAFAATGGLDGSSRASEMAFVFVIAGSGAAFLGASWAGLLWAKRRYRRDTRGD